MSALGISDTAVFRGVGLCRDVRDGRTVRPIVDHVDLAIEPGEIVLLTGPSGSGKSTLLHLVSGFDVPSGGERSWREASSGDAGRPRRLPPAAFPKWLSVAVVPQSLGLLPELSYLEQMQLAARGNDDSIGAIGELMTLLDLDALRPRLPGETSLGQQQRLAAARAMAAGPMLIVADEPTSHQDAEHAEVVAAAFAHIAGQGSACLIASHDEHLHSIATRVLTMRDGRLVHPH